MRVTRHAVVTETARKNSISKFMRELVGPY